VLLVDVSFTSHCTAPTGVQRVTREVYRQLSREGRALAVCFDRWCGRWRTLNGRERERMDSPVAARYTNHRHHWSVDEVAVGMISRLIPYLNRDTRLPAEKFAGLIVPEKLENRTPKEIRALESRLAGASISVFHDLIPIKFPQYATQKSASEFPRYLASLLHYDGVAAVSESSRQDLLSYWAENGVRDPPPVEAISPGTGLTSMGVGIESPDAGSRPEVLMVGTIEARKNHVSVLEACERLWALGNDFGLTLAGRLSSDTGREVPERVRALQGRNRPIQWVGHVGDEDLKRLYRSCRFTLHPSLYEGFGLPVLESLSYARPCVVTDLGALGQVAREGGCYVVADPTPAALADAIRELLLDSTLYQRLVRECRQRRFKQWDEYCRELTAWQRSLKKRGHV
jgi:glycosyltransferase involved in cell wall biosynthesis